MKITILAVGKIKEGFFASAIEEYAKRLRRYCKLEILEVADEKTPEDASQREEDQIRAREGERILKRIRDDAYVAALVIKGEQMTSEAFAEKLDRLGISGHSHVVFVIGGSLGLSPEVLARADAQVSFSRLTFPHQLMRVILLEQVYRAYRIIHHEPYHK